MLARRFVVASQSALIRGVAIASRRLRGLPRDQRGTISMLSTFALLMFTILLLLVTNVAIQVDDKVIMQNAADSAAYSGGVVLARGMNAIAFTNHLECDVLAVTAFLREARDQNVVQFVPTILDRWRTMSQDFLPAEFEKFIPLPTAIPDKADKEQELVTAWSEMAHSAAEFALPVFEFILGTPEDEQSNIDDHLIPNFQRDLLLSIPTLAQEVTNEVALRHGMPSSRVLNAGPAVRNNPQSAANNRGPQWGMLWRTSVLPVGLADETDPTTRTLPIVDPDPSKSDFYRVSNGSQLLQASVQRRNGLARHYLETWIHDPDVLRGLGFFGGDYNGREGEAKMSTFQALYRMATCAYLNELLDEEYPTTNVPMMLRDDFGGAVQGNRVLDQAQVNTVLERDYTFLGLAYRTHPRELAPGSPRVPLYRNPLRDAGDALTYSQISLYIPRYMYRFQGGRWWGTATNQSRVNGQVETRYSYSHYTNGWPSGWDLFNQNWTVRLIPATSPSLPEIMQTNPGGFLAGVQLPNLGGATSTDIDAVSTH